VVTGEVGFQMSGAPCLLANIDTQEVRTNSTNEQQNKNILYKAFYILIFVHMYLIKIPLSPVFQDDHRKPFC
jgi:hypothetical protein